MANEEICCIAKIRDIRSLNVPHFRSTTDFQEIFVRVDDTLEVMMGSMQDFHLARLAPSEEESVAKKGDAVMAVHACVVCALRLSSKQAD